MIMQWSWPQFRQPTTRVWIKKKERWILGGRMVWGYSSFGLFEDERNGLLLSHFPLRNVALQLIEARGQPLLARILLYDCLWDSVRPLQLSYCIWYPTVDDDCSEIRELLSWQFDCCGKILPDVVEILASFISSSCRIFAIAVPIESLIYLAHYGGKVFSQLLHRFLYGMLRSCV